MIVNCLYIFIVTVWKKLVAYYDNSIIGRFVARVCNFFGSKCSESKILFRFKESFMNTKFVQHSITSSIISFPFTLLKSIYQKFEKHIESIKEKSVLLDFVRNAGYLSLRDFGKMAISFCLGGIAVLIYKGFMMSPGGLFLVGLTVAGVFMLTCTATIRNTFFSSAVIRFICSLLFINPCDFSDRVYIVKFKKLLYIIPAIIGALCCYVNLPTMLIGLAAAVCMVAVLWKTEIGVYVFVSFAPVLPTMVLVGLIGITMVSYAIHLAFDKKTTYKTSSFTILIALFLFVTAFSAFTSIARASSIKAFLVYAVFTVAFTLIVNTIKTKAQYKSLVASFLLVAFGVAVYGVIQNFSDMETTQSWIDSSLFGSIKTRVYSTLDNPNVLGQFFILSIPLVLAFAMSVKKRSLRISYTVILLISVMCLIFTWSRAAWVGVLLATGIILIKKDKRFVGVCVFALALAPFVLPQSILERIVSIGNTDDSSIHYRISVWTASLYMVRDFFFTGVGLGTDAFFSAYPRYALGGANFALHAHNFYLQLVADMGIMGLVTFVLIILTCYRCIANIKSNSPLIKYIGFAISGSLIGYLFQGMAETMWYNYHMILIFWIFMAFAYIASVTPKGDGADD